MQSDVTSRPAVGSADARASRLRLTRGISATWWYTISGVFFFELMVVFIWCTGMLEAGAPPPRILAVLVGGLVWVAATVPLMLRYRLHVDGLPDTRWFRTLLPLIVSAGFGWFAGSITGFWVAAVWPLAQSLALVHWPRGIRLRTVIAVTLLLVILTVVDFRVSVLPDDSGTSARQWLLPCLFAILLPSMTAVSLWWWDVVVSLDRARASEARLGATQERLRVATDVHDLQGHHLQVIALQLELTERLLTRDPEAALAQVRAARRSVDEARQGTRDLALRFRTVPLRDEVANAADLLRAAGTSVESVLSEGSDRAPAAVLGPVIRETTTNVLRHGGGRWARLRLERSGSQWRYEVSNDPGSDSASGDAAVDAREGAGLAGILRRVEETGGTVEVRRGRQEFSVAILVPEEAP